MGNRKNRHNVNEVRVIKSQTLIYLVMTKCLNLA